MELLAPAGGYEQLEYALHFGADAVYVGGERFGLRQRADNFDLEGLREATTLTHEAGKRIFVTCNALLHPGDEAAFASYIEQLTKLGVDAIILSDLGALRIVRDVLQVAPHATASQFRPAIHVSTQASVTNAGAALQWYELGARRIVLARELTLKEIAAIRTDLNAAGAHDLELEVFVHGAMCVAYSGRCLISAYLNDRDANQGHCTQPCRWNYALIEETRPDKQLPLAQDFRGTYLMSSQDLMMLEHLDDLREAGVDSLKIEGRVKGAYYVATVVNAYRHVLDGADPQAFLPEMERVSHRPYHTGFFFGAPDQTYDAVEYTQTHDLVARVLSCEAVGATWRVTVQQRNRFGVGDTIEVLSPGRPVRELSITEIRTEYDEPVECANRATDTYVLTTPFPVEPLDLLRRERT